MLDILPYHALTTNFFQKQSDIWQFFANPSQQEEQLRAFKADLLKNTYKFDPAAEVALYEKVHLAKEKLDLQLPVTLYQAPRTDEMNATIVYLDGEAHIVFSGDLMQLLNDEELLAIIGHELSHVLLYNQLGGSLEVTDRIIAAIANHSGSTQAQYETARLFRLYTEIFCDRGAYIVTGSYQPVVASLVKMSTGLQTVNADSYIKQAEEIFELDTAIKAAGVSHPENFIRARAIYIWHTKGKEGDPLIQQMIEGPAGMDELDLFAQHRLAGLTEQLITLLLQPIWIKTPPVTALAKQYSDNLALHILPDKSQVATQIRQLHASVQEYLAYVLYDFATADKTLEDVPLGYCFFLADELKLEKAFAGVVKRERKLTDKKIQSLKKLTIEEYIKQNLPSA